MIDDIKNAVMEKPVVTIIFVAVGIVAGYFLQPVISKLIGRRR